MTDLLTAAQMRAIEGAAIESGAATGRDLMERAGRGLVAAVVAHWPALARGPHRALRAPRRPARGHGATSARRRRPELATTTSHVACGPVKRTRPP